MCKKEVYYYFLKRENAHKRQVKKKLTHKVEEYTEGSAEIYKKIFGNIPERFREEKDFREIEYLEKCKIEYIILHSRLIQIESQSAFFMLIFIHSQFRKTDWLLIFSRKEEST